MELLFRAQIPVEFDFQKKIGLFCFSEGCLPKDLYAAYVDSGDSFKPRHCISNKLANDLRNPVLAAMQKISGDQRLPYYLNCECGNQQLVMMDDFCATTDPVICSACQKEYPKIHYDDDRHMIFSMSPCRDVKQEFCAGYSVWQKSDRYLLSFRIKSFRVVNGRSFFGNFYSTLVIRNNGSIYSYSTKRKKDKKFVFSAAKAIMKIHDAVSNNKIATDGLQQLFRQYSGFDYPVANVSAYSFYLVALAKEYDYPDKMLQSLLYSYDFSWLLYKQRDFAKHLFSRKISLDSPRKAHRKLTAAIRVVFDTVYGPDNRSAIYDELISMVQKSGNNISDFFMSDFIYQKKKKYRVNTVAGLIEVISKKQSLSVKKVFDGF